MGLSKEKVTEPSVGIRWKFARKPNPNDFYGTDHVIECPSTNKWSWVYRHKQSAGSLK